jgi:hypothetical protein
MMNRTFTGVSDIAHEDPEALTILNHGLSSFPS